NVLQRVIDKTTESGGTISTYSLMIGGDDKIHFEIATTKGNYSLVGATVVPQGLPAHLAATYDSATMRVYLNGILDASTAASGDILTTTTQPLGLGNQVTRDRPLKATVGEVALYGSALDRVRILAHYNASAAADARASLACSGTPICQVLFFDPIPGE